MKIMLGLLAIIVGDGYAAHLCLNPKREALRAEDCALGLEFEMLSKEGER